MIFLTNEQEEIVYSEASNIAVNANAGTGKTTTLIEFSKIRKQNTFLYLVYNAENRKHAENKFPHYVKIHTIHSLARERIGYKYNHKIYNNIEIDTILKEYDYFKEVENDSDAAYRLAYHVAMTINAYCNSDKERIEDICEIGILLKYAQDYWNKMIDIKNEKIFITHEGYLKLYQLSKPILEFDYIMVDEAQDSNEAMLDIVIKQTTRKLFIGDPNQKIYGFRGALNIFNEEKYLSQLDNLEVFTLTHSFRFGEKVADVANCILNGFKTNFKEVIGHPDIDSKLMKVDKDIQYTAIFRTNAALIEYAIEQVNNGKKIHIIGGIDAMYAKILDIYNLYINKKNLIKNDYIKTLKNYNHFKAVAINLKKADYLLLVLLFDKYESNLMIYINNIRKNIEGKKGADIILTTAHKSKGLEFVNVLIFNDFIELYNFSPDSGEEEVNLIYVAVTRAIDTLELNQDLLNFTNRRTFQNG